MNVSSDFGGDLTSDGVICDLMGHGTSALIFLCSLQNRKGGSNHFKDADND